MVVKNKLITAANFRDFDWNKAKLFYHIAKCGSLMEAARLADTDQSTLTRQIQALEKQVGFPLLIRRSIGITLTRKGEELLKEVTPFFLKMKGFCGNNYVEIGEEKKRKIRITTTHALAAYVINDLLLTYNEDHPHLIFELISDDHSLDIILNDVDIAIRPISSMVRGTPTETSVQQEYLFSLEKKLYASSKYLEKYGEPQTVEDLKNHYIIAIANPEQHPYADVNWILRLGMPEGQFHQPIYTSNSLECRIKAAKNGKGIISGYEEMSILREANLKNILPNVRNNELKDYFIYPNYLKEDKDIIGIKKHLQKSLKTLISLEKT